MARLAPLTSRTRHGGPARLGPLLGKRQEPLERLMGVGEVSLQGDPGAKAGELRRSQAPSERLHRQVEVPVLLHVQVDQLRDRRADAAARYSPWSGSQIRCY